MNPIWNGETAKILQFPAGGRRGVGDRRATMQAIEDLEAQLPKVIVDGWYHDAAMQEAASVGKR